MESVREEDIIEEMNDNNVKSDAKYGINGDNLNGNHNLNNENDFNVDNKEIVKDVFVSIHVSHEQTDLEINDNSNGLNENESQANNLLEKKIAEIVDSIVKNDNQNENNGNETIENSKQSVEQTENSNNESVKANDNIFYEAVEQFEVDVTEDNKRETIAANTDEVVDNRFEPKPLYERSVFTINSFGQNENQKHLEGDEQEDELSEFGGFQNKLKMWSMKSTSSPPSQQSDNKDKFKTLRQIRKGNTRSLAERFELF